MEYKTIRIKDLPDSLKPRERLINDGVKHLSNQELLSIILRTGSKDLSALDLANQILVKTRGVRKLCSMGVSDFTRFKGIGESKACQIMASIELSKRITNLSKEYRVKITCPEDIYNVFKDELRFETVEKFMIGLMNTKNEIISVKEITTGILNSSLVHPREVFKQAISESAASIILVHNHPSGNSKPSSDDIKITKRLYEAGDIIGIKVIDHLIIGDDEYYSLKENHMI